MAPVHLDGQRVAFLATDMVEQAELTGPWQAVERAGGQPELLSLAEGRIQGFHHDDKADTFAVDKAIEEARVEDYAALVLPGGVGNPDKLRMDENAVAFVREFVASGKPVAAICHGPWLLVEAGAVRGRTLTSYPSLQTDIRNAGGTWVDEQVVTDRAIVTSRGPQDLEAFCDRLLAEIGEGRHERHGADTIDAAASAS